MNRKVVPVVVILAIVAAVVCGVALHRRSRLAIGVILPLTGADAAEGLGMRNGIRLAVDEVNARGGIQGKKVSLEILDGPTDEKATEAARSLLRSRVAVMEYGYDMDGWLAARDVFREAGVIGVVPGFVSAEMLLGSQMAKELRLMPLAAPEFTATATYAWQVLGARKPMLIRETTQFGAVGVNHFRGGLGLMQKKVLRGLDTIIKRGEGTYPSVTDRYRKEENDYVFFSGRPIEAAIVLRELRAAGYRGPFEIAGPGPSHQFLALAKEQAEGAITVFPGLPAEDTEGGKAFLAAYAAHGFREPPGFDGVFAYASTQAILKAMDKSFLTTPSIWGALNHEEFDTAVSNHLRFISYTTSTYNETVIYKVINGQWKPIYTAKPDDKEHAEGAPPQMFLTPYAAK